MKNKYFTIGIMALFSIISAFYFYDKKFLEGWFLHNIYVKYILGCFQIFLSFKALSLIYVSIEKKESKNMLYSLVSFLMMHTFPMLDIAKGSVSVVLLVSNFIELPIFCFLTGMNIYYTFLNRKIDEKKYIWGLTVVTMLWMKVYLQFLNLSYFCIPNILENIFIKDLVNILILLYTYKPLFFLYDAIKRYHNIENMKETKLEEEFTKNIQEIKKLKGYNNKSISLRSFNKLVQLSAGTEVLNIVTFLIALKATVIYICVNIILIYTVKHLLQKSEGMKNFLSFLFRSPPLALVCIMTLIVYIERSKIYQLSHLFQNPVVIFSLLCFVAIRYRKKIHTAICI